MGYINCSHCGRTLMDDAAFCPICGTPVVRDAEGNVPESAASVPEPAAPMEPAAPAEPAAPMEPAAPAAPADGEAASTVPVDPVAPPPSPYGAPVAPSGQPGQGDAAPTNPYGAPVGNPYEPPQPQQPQQPANPYGAPVGNPYAPLQPTQEMPAGQPPYGAPQQPYGAPQQPGGMPPYGAAPGVPGGVPGMPPQQPVPYAQVGNDGKGRGKATASLVLGIISIVLGSLLFGIIAIVLSSQYTKKFGPDGRAKAGKICGIVGSVISVIIIAVLICFSSAVFDSNEIDVQNNAAPITSVEPEGSAEPDAQPSGSIDAETKAAAEAAQAGLDRLKNPDDAMIKAMAAEADTQFKNSFDYSLTDIGVDPVELMTWSVGTLECQLDADGVYIDGDDGEAYADTTCVTFYALMKSVSDQVGAFNEAEGGVTSDEEAKAKYAEFVENAKAQAAPEDYFLRFELEKKGGSWAVEEDSFLEEAEYVYSMYDIF